MVGKVKSLLPDQLGLHFYTASYRCDRNELFNFVSYSFLLGETEVILNRNVLRLDEKSSVCANIFATDYSYYHYLYYYSQVTILELVVIVSPCGYAIN